MAIWPALTPSAQSFLRSSVRSFVQLISCLSLGCHINESGRANACFQDAERILAKQRAPVLVGLTDWFRG